MSCPGRGTAGAALMSRRWLFGLRLICCPGRRGPLSCSGRGTADAALVDVRPRFSRGSAVACNAPVSTWLETGPCICLGACGRDDSPDVRSPHQQTSPLTRGPIPKRTVVAPTHTTHSSALQMHRSSDTRYNNQTTASRGDVATSSLSSIERTVIPGWLSTPPGMAATTTSCRTTPFLQATVITPPPVERRTASATQSSNRIES